MSSLLIPATFEVLSGMFSFLDTLDCSLLHAFLHSVA